jgi:hypothetical protein
MQKMTTPNIEHMHAQLAITPRARLASGHRVRREPLVPRRLTMLTMDNSDEINSEFQCGPIDATKAATKAGGERR